MGMNAISWTAGHICWQWTLRAARAGLAQGLTAQEEERLNTLRKRVNPFRNGADDPTPPALADALSLFDAVKQASRWVDSAGDDLMATMVEGRVERQPGDDYKDLNEWLLARTIPDENLGTAFMRNVLHTWFHIGEINLARQMLGHREIPFVGKLIRNLEWYLGTVAAGYRPYDLATFALHSFGRGLEKLSLVDAETRVRKADGSETNAISWIVAHLARHWLSAREDAGMGAIPGSWDRFATGSPDGTPPPLAEALQILERAKEGIGWIADAGEDLLTNGPPSRRSGERPGTRLMRALLYTWFHIGEINGIRQVLGHPEIGIVGKMAGNLEWRTDGTSASRPTAVHA
jgi:hypothetical protein